MKRNLGVIGLIAALGLFVTLAYGQQAGTQSDAAMQGQTGGQQTQQMTKDPQVVSQVQEKLNEQGYKVGKVDGKWGSKTQQALKKFQQAKGMSATGELDQQTMSELGISASGAGAGGQSKDSMDQQSGAGTGGQQGMEQQDQQSGAGDQQGMGQTDQQSGTGGQQDMNKQQESSGQMGGEQQKSGSY